MNVYEESLKMHQNHKGKLEITSKVKLTDKTDLTLAYTPGVAEPCRKIAANKEDVYKYTIKSNTVAVVSDGSAVLGLGNIGAEAAIPVMEGKAILFKKFAGVDAFPICLATQDVNEIVETVVRIAPVFGGINLEDISAPRCVEVEALLREKLDIPVFHDDQHGTAIVVLAALINGIKLVNKKAAACKVVINGTGAAGSAIAKMLCTYGFKNLVLCDKDGVLNLESLEKDAYRLKLMEDLGLKGFEGTLRDAMKAADIFIGVSAAGVVTQEMVASMNKDAIVLAMANPEPEIMPQLAKEAGARIVGSGRSDFDNQVNNVLAFPGIFRGALDVRATCINDEMKIAAAEAIASLVGEGLSETYIIPSALDERVADIVADKVAEAAINSGVAQMGDGNE